MSHRTLSAVFKAILIALVALTTPSLEPASGKPQGTNPPNSEDKEVASRIRQAYEDMGYTRVMVHLKQSTSGTREFEVQLGRRYRLGAIEFRGNKQLPTALLMQAAPKVGGIFTSKVLTDFIDSISRKYAAAGLVPRYITPDVKADNSNNTVTLTLRIEE